ncbi:MAG: hypothetical protein ACEQSK_00830 [Sphingomonadaceae bacterium]
MKPSSLLLPLVAAVLLACSTPPSAAPAASSADLLRQIEAQAAPLACSSSEQCHTLAVGAKACGGPERYLPWSSQQQDGSALRALAERHAALRRLEDRQSGMLSNCLAVQDPGASCNAGRCTLRTPVPAGNCRTPAKQA